MHSLFSGVLAKHYFAEAPQCPYDGDFDTADLESIQQMLAAHHQDIAAVILEPSCRVPAACVSITLRI